MRGIIYSSAEMTEKSHRAITYRLIPGTKCKAEKLASLAGACRWAWNEMLDLQQQTYEAASLAGSKAPSPSFYSLGTAFTQLRAVTPWLQELPYKPVRYTMKYQADAWRAFFTGKGRHPKFKGKHGDDSVTIPENVKVKSGKLWVPKLGWYVIRRKGNNPYADNKPVQAVIKQVLGKWYAVITYEVDVEQVDNGLAIGVDMNVRQVATSTGDILHIPNTERLEARKKRYQRMMSRRAKGSNRRALARYRAAKTSRRISNALHNWSHQVSRVVADTAGLVAVEDLKTKAMTAKGKRGLNREILNTGWSQLRQMLEYKAASLVSVNPAYTSQTCRKCGHTDKKNRKSQSEFECVSCGHTGNADINAALNILALGIGASGRGGAYALASPMSRQKMQQLAV